MSVGLARLIGSQDARRRQLEAALLFAEAQSGAVTGNDLTVLLPGAFERREVEYLLLELCNAGALKQLSREREGPLSDKYAIDPKVLRETLLLAQGYAQGIEQMNGVLSRATTVDIVATLPQGLNLPPRAAPPVQLAASLHRLVVDATQQLIILNPFFETTGLQFLHGALEAAARRGVAITVVTRDLSDMGTPNRRALLNLNQQLLAAGLQRRLSVYNYHVGQEHQTVQTLHAKMVISDETAAYVGSANLTQYGLGRHLEVGVLLRGPQVAALANIVDGVLHSGLAELIDL